VSARDRIFARLKDRMDKPQALKLEPPSNISCFFDPLASFKKGLRAAGAEAIEVDRSDLLDRAIEDAFDGCKVIIDTRKSQEIDSKSLLECDLAILEASFGVAENGAVWIAWKESFPRALLCLAKNLAIVLSQLQIVETMHEAYDLIEFNELSYGIFLCGPSKTADIEQSLVIGAHGAIDLKLFLTPLSSI